ncbi:MAG: hypothetical protein K1X75_16120 [Leptospirales bacterium]|nr:hypothetical protein [Leptospirales bacterium]
MEIVQAIVWIVLFSVCGGVAFFLDYWLRLFQQKDSYERDELLDFTAILRREFEILTVRGEAGLNYLALAAGVGGGWTLTLLGGLLSPDQVALVPDHGENQVPNYFFQSFLFVGVLHAIWPSLRDFAIDRGGPDGLLARLLESETPFFFGICCCLAAMSLTMWGVYHEMSFLFSAANAIVCIGYALYRLRQAASGGDYEQEDGDY